MKRYLIAALIMARAAWGVGTCNVNNNQTAVVSISCTGDASTGSFPATAITNLVYPLSQVEIVPGTTAPTPGWSVTLNDFNGADQLTGQATNLGASGTQAYAVSSTRVNTGSLTLNITGNSVASATVVIWLYLGQNSPTPPGRSITEKGTRWQVNNSGTAGSGVQGTISKAAAAGVRHVVDCIGFSAAALAAVTAANVNLNVRDGATGAGTIIQQYALAEPTAGAAGIQLVPATMICGLNIIGSPNTAMTIEFSALTTGAVQSVNMTGFDLE